MIWLHRIPKSLKFVLLPEIKQSYKFKRFMVQTKKYFKKYDKRLLINILVIE